MAMLDDVLKLSDREGRSVLVCLTSYMDAATNQGHTVDKEDFERVMRTALKDVKESQKLRG